MLWFGATAIHVLWYAPRLPRLLSSRSPAGTGRGSRWPEQGRRWLLLTAALAVGLVIALATYHLAGNWTGFMAHGGG